MKLMSYNLRQHHAAPELASLASQYAPDALCLQEADTKRLPLRIGDLELVHATAETRLGLAVYLRTGRFQPQGMQIVSMKKSLYDRFMKPGLDRLLMVRALDEKYDRDIVVASFHAAPLSSLNSLRRQQIRTAFTALHEIGPGLPAVMAGDFNYPLFQAGLRKHIDLHGFAMNRSDKGTYSRYRFLKGNYDFALSRGFGINEVLALPQGKSDHLPILVETSLEHPLTPSAKPMDEKITLLPSVQG